LVPSVKGLRAGALLELGVQQLDHLRDPLGALGRATFGRIDPAQISAPVELREGVEECSGPGAGGQRVGDVRGEVVALRAFRQEHHLYSVAATDPAAPHPHRPEGESVAIVPAFENPAHTHPVDGAGDVMPRLHAPRLIGVEGYDDEQAAAPTVRGRGGETLWHHKLRWCHAARPAMSVDGYSIPGSGPAAVAAGIRARSGPDPSGRH